MKAKRLSLLSVIILSIGVNYAGTVNIGDLYFKLNAIAQTAEVTSQNGGYPYWSTNITEADIPASVTYDDVTYSVTSIGNLAFNNCRYLTSVSIPNSVTSIGELAFEYCSSLTSVTMSNSITRIEYAVFQYCTGLTSIEIPNGVTSIENRAFFNCTGLTSVTIPNSVTSIGSNAFAYCSGVTSLICRADNTPVLGYYAFYEVDKSIPLYVPSGSIAAYQAADQWNEFTNIRAILEDKDTIIACGDVYIWHDMVLTENGDYTDDINDSTTAILHLTFIKPEYVSDSITISYDDTLTWHGMTLLESGTYFDTITSITGCDSVIYQMNLTVLPYVPPTVTIFGEEIVITDSTDSTIIVEEVDFYGDSTLVYNTQENTLTFNSLELEVGDSVSAAISYTGSDPLIIVLHGSSTIFADTIISSASDIIITGGGRLVAEGVVPIIGAETATIIFDSVSMYVRSLSSSAAMRHRIRGAKRLNKTGNPALSRFASTNFNKTEVSPPEAEYGSVKMEESGGQTSTINALYVTNEAGEKVVLTEFTLTAIADSNDAVETTNTPRALDINRPMYNILGVQIDASQGIVIQNGQKYLLK